MTVITFIYFFILFSFLLRCYLRKGNSHPTTKCVKCAQWKKQMTDAHQIILKWFLLPGILVDPILTVSTDPSSFKTMKYLVIFVAFSVCGSGNNGLLWPITFFPEDNMIIFWTTVGLVDCNHYQFFYFNEIHVQQCMNKLKT